MFKEKLREFLTGRYGGDLLSASLASLSSVSMLAGVIVLSFVKGVPGLVIALVLFAVSLGAMGLAIFRVFSKNLTARRAEYEWFKKNVADPIAGLFSKKKSAPRRDSEHRLFKCPKCRQTVRVPKGKGKIRITCPKCGEVFVKKT